MQRAALAISHIPSLKRMDEQRSQEGHSLLEVSLHTIPLRCLNEHQTRVGSPAGIKIEKWSKQASLTG
jgi:hypothetical protein